MAALRLVGSQRFSRRAALLVAGAALLTGLALAADRMQEATEFTETLENELVPGGHVMVFKPMHPMSQEEAKRLPVPLQAQDNVYLGRLRCPYWKSEP